MINLTIQSENNKIIDIIDITNNSLLNSTSNNNTLNLNYTNLLIDIQTNSSTNFTKLYESGNNITNDVLWIFVILILFGCIFFAIKLIKKL